MEFFEFECFISDLIYRTDENFGVLDSWRRVDNDKSGDLHNINVFSYMYVAPWLGEEAMLEKINELIGAIEQTIRRGGLFRFLWKSRYMRETGWAEATLENIVYNSQISEDSSRTSTLTKSFSERRTAVYVQRVFIRVYATERDAYRQLVLTSASQYYGKQVEDLVVA